MFEGDGEYDDLDTAEPTEDIVPWRDFVRPRDKNKSIGEITRSPGRCVAKSLGARIAYSAVQQQCM